MTLKRQTRYFAGGLCLTLVLIGMICGLILVDLSSERYMPGMFPHFYLIERLDAQGVYFYWLGRPYQIDAERVREGQQAAWPWRGLIPRGLRMAGGAVVAALDWGEPA